MEIWLCDTCGEIYEVQEIKREGEQQTLLADKPIAFRQHNNIHKAEGEAYAWISLGKKA